MRSAVSIVLMLACLSTLSSSASAMVQAKSGSDAGLTSVRAIVLFDEGMEVEHLLINATLEAADAERLGWIVPIPAASARVRVVHPDAFSVMAASARVAREAPGARSPKKGAPARPVQAPPSMPSVKIAGVNIDVHTFDVAGEDARKALEAWLSERGLDAPPEQTLTYYAERGWTYVAVDLTPEPGKKTITPGALPGLGLSFRAKGPVFPINALRGHGDVDVTLYTMTKKVFKAPDFATATKLGFDVAGNGFLKYIPSAKSKKKGSLTSPVQTLSLIHISEPTRPY